jgi:hypothetical protein
LAELKKLDLGKEICFQARKLQSDLEKAAAKANHDITFGSIAKQVGHFENP